MWKTVEEESSVQIRLDIMLPCVSFRDQEVVLQTLLSFHLLRCQCQQSLAEQCIVSLKILYYISLLLNYFF